jgi:hypothetical protein
MTTRTIEKAKLAERIGVASESVTAWAESRLLVNTVLPDSTIAALFADYTGFCRDRGCPALIRKTWIATMKLAGFESRAGAFVDVILKGSASTGIGRKQREVKPERTHPWGAPEVSTVILDSDIPF